jgi:hypothetical protein
MYKGSREILNKGILYRTARFLSLHIQTSNEQRDQERPRKVASSIFLHAARPSMDIMPGAHLICMNFLLSLAYHRALAPIPNCFPYSTNLFIRLELQVQHLPQYLRPHIIDVESHITKQILDFFMSRLVDKIKDHLQRPEKWVL